MVALTTALLGCATTAQADPVRARIVLYNGFGTPAGARLWGRVLEDKGHGKAKPGESTWRKLRRTASALESDEVPNAPLEVHVLGRKLKTRSDSDGMFSIKLAPPLAPGSHKVSARLLGKRPCRTEPAVLQIWPAKPGVVVISDIDDTVLDTGVTSKRKLLKKVLLRNAHDLQTFAGASGLFGVWARRGYPVVFVSGSPNNLYSRLSQFLALKRFPAAPLLLKNLGQDKLTEQRAYKLRQIKRTLELLPGYKMILVGDSGEQDPEVYTEVKRRHPGRVLAVGIHRVTREVNLARRFKGQVLFGSYRKLAKKLHKMGLLTKAEYKAVKNKEQKTKNN